MNWFAALASVYMAFAASAQDLPLADPPEDFPVFSFSINPIYHSIGLQLGHVLSIRRERIFIRTFEGEMMLGVGSNPGSVVDRQCVRTVLDEQGPSGNQQVQDARQRRANTDCFLFDNPWRFSTLKTPVFNKIAALKNDSMLIYYINYHVAPSYALTKTTNKVLDAFATVPNLKIKPRYRISSWSGLHPEAGIITGRVVRASLEYSLRKTYEVIIQESENADHFRAMSINDGRLFRYVTQAMLTGKLLRIEYVRLFQPHSRFLSALFNYMTDYRIISVEIAEEPGN